MKIVIFIGGLSGGGAERVACNLCNALIANDNEVEFLTMSDERTAYPIDNKATRYYLLKESEKKNSVYNIFLRFFRFIKYLINEEVDLYIVMLPVTIIMLLAFSFMTKAKIIASERADPTNYPSKIQKLLKLLCGRADGWVFQTPDALKWYESRLGISEKVIIPNAINSSFLDMSEPKERQKIIITSGRLKTQKRHDVLVSAFSKVAYKFSDYNLVILGEGPSRGKLENQIKDLHLDKRVFLPGYVDDVKERLSSASLFVLASDYEGMPNALIEAMALGLPCISTDCDGGGARFLIRDGENGILVPKNDVDALAHALDRILSNEELAQKLGRNAEKVKEDLHPDIIYGEWLQFTEDIVHAK